MTDHSDQNPYAPPSEEALRDDRSAPVGDVARNPTDIPGRAWSLFRDLLDEANRLHLLTAVVGIQLAANLLQDLPQLAAGQTHLEIFNPAQMAARQQGAQEFAGVSLATGCVSALVGLAVYYFAFSLARPLRRIHYRGSEAVRSFGEAASIGSERLPQIIGVHIIWGMMIFAGICLILPALVLGLTFWIPLYIAATTDHGVGDILSHSFSFLGRQWRGIAVTVLVTIGGVLVTAVPSMAVAAVPGVGLVLASITGAAVYGLLRFWIPAVMIALEERDREIFESDVWDESDDEPSPASAEW